MIDTHCHLYLEDFDNDINEIIARATQEKVERFYLPAINSNHHKQMIDLEDSFPGKCFAMMGLHPCYVKEDFGVELKEVEKYLSSRKFSAVGEIGIDLYWDTTFLKEQYEAFRKQIGWAVENKLPIVIHSRNATRECIEVVKEFERKGITGIFHCFSGSEEEALEITGLGFYLGIGGVVTYKNSGLDKVLAGVDLKNLVLETDAPYLTPVPYRGKRNESSYLPLISSKLASIYSVPVEEVDRVTTLNATTIFG